MKKKGPRIKNTFKSGFVRSLSIPLIATFLAIAAAIVLLVYFSFAKRLKARITANKWEEFTAIEDNITERLEEFDLIANDIYKSPTFLFADLPADKKQGYNMTSEVKRYLVGNQFLSYLIYYRNANPDKFFSSEGEINTKHFWDTYLNFEGETLDGFLGEIRDSYRHDVLPMRKSASRVVPNKTYLTLLEPIPLASPNPCAFAIGFVEKKTLNSYMDSIFSSCDGEIVIYDSGNNYLYDYKSGLDLDDETLSLVREKSWVDNQASFRHGGRTYVVQKSVSSYDKWQFFAVYDAKSLYREVFIAELFIYVILAFVVLTALIFCLTVIARKFSPINQLAVSVMKDEDTEGKSVIDEHGLLQSRFLSLFEEKKKMYTALFFSNLMANQYDKALLEDALDEYNIEFHGNIFCPLAIMGGFDQDDRELVTKVTDCAWECLNSESITSYIHINMSPYCLVVCMNGQMDSFSYGNLVDIIRSLHEQMQKRFGIEINVGIGNIMSNLLDYPKNVTQAVSAALTCLSNPDTYFTEYGSGESEALPEEASAFISRLSVSIKQNNVKEVAANFSFLDERKAGHKQTRVQENYMAYSVALMLLEYAKEAGEGERLDKVFSLLSSGRGNIDEIYGLIRDIAVDITTAREEKSRRDREERSQAHELLIKIKKVIDERLCDSMLSLDVLAEECGVSPSYLSRYFKQRMDCTPMAYVENARMDIAKNYLVTTELSLDEILEKSGYIDKSNFIRKFKKREGMTPMSYRKAMSDAE